MKLNANWKRKKKLEKTVVVTVRKKKPPFPEACLRHVQDDNKMSVPTREKPHNRQRKNPKNKQTNKQKKNKPKE